METLLHIVQTINFYLSDYILVVLLVGTGVFFSLRTRFVQVRCFGEGMRRVFGGFSMRGGRQKGGLSSFQALTTAIAAQVGLASGQRLGVLFRKETGLSPGVYRDRMRR